MYAAQFGIGFENVSRNRIDCCGLVFRSHQRIPKSA